MKKIITVSAMILLAFTGFMGCTGNQSDGFITVDVTKSYPSKELILQDFMDVEYIPLETTDEFLNQGFVEDIGEKYILVRNRNSDGDIFVYDRNGKAIRKINRKGQGGEEYNAINNITLDEDNEEIFVNDISSKKIKVYDLYGKFKRSLKHKIDSVGKSMFYTPIHNYDRNNLICYDFYNEKITFVLVSKQDGSITKDIEVPFKEKKRTDVRRKDEASGMTYVMFPGNGNPIVPCEDHLLLAEISADTIYTFLQDYSLKPFIVRTPSIQTMDPPEVFLFIGVLCDRYYFMETLKRIYDFNTDKGFPTANLMYDKQEKAIFEYTVYNGDYSNKQEVYMNGNLINHKIASWQSLEAYKLIEAYKKDELKGKLKEIASTLDPEDNPVIMLVKPRR